MNAPVLEAPPASSPALNPRPRGQTPPVRSPKSSKPPIPAEKRVSDKTNAIMARVNVGWGNTLYIRGEGGCLSWDIGLPMLCSGGDCWVWSCRAGQAPREFKFLINDVTWAEGGNLVMSGADITICSPVFVR